MDKCFTKGGRNEEILTEANPIRGSLAPACVHFCTSASTDGDGSNPTPGIPPARLLEALVAEGELRVLLGDAATDLGNTTHRKGWLGPQSTMELDAERSVVVTGGPPPIPPTICHQGIPRANKVKPKAQASN